MSEPLTGYEATSVADVEAFLDDNPAASSDDVYLGTVGHSERAIAAVAAKRAGGGGGGSMPTNVDWDENDLNIHEASDSGPLTPSLFRLKTLLASGLQLSVKVAAYFTDALTTYNDNGDVLFESDPLANAGDGEVRINGSPFSAAGYQQTSEKGQPDGYAALDGGGLVAGYQQTSEKGQANGYASLGSDGLVPNAQLPSSLATRSVYASSSPVPIADGASANLRLDSLVTGDAMLDPFDEVRPVFLEAGTYAVTTNVSADGMTSAGYALIEMSFPAQGVIGCGQLEARQQFGGAVAIVNVAAGDELNVVVFNYDGAATRSFQVDQATIVKLA